MRTIGERSHVISNILGSSLRGKLLVGLKKTIPQVLEIEPRPIFKTCEEEDFVPNGLERTRQKKGREGWVKTRTEAPKVPNKGARVLTKAKEQRCVHIIRNSIQGER